MMADSNSLSLSRRPFILTLALGAVLLGLLVTGILLVGGPPTSGTANESGGLLAQATEDEEDAEADVVETMAIEVTYDLFLARDPFESIRPPEPPPADPDPGQPTTPTTPTSPTTPTTPSPGSPSTPSDPSSPPAEGQAVEVIEIGTDHAGDPIAVVQVGPTAYEVGIGDTFAGHLLLTVDENCISWLRGDTVRTGCVGDQAK